ncbi:MAG: hypothetical protein H0W88_06235 [Parachlamydiaceae bacterium]|nr:hypothetical protein [Parachlamydiaceae bacterium]
MKEEIKRVFFALEVVSPWPEEYPKGRILDIACRHLTLAFLGNIPFQKLKGALNSFPLVPPKIGLVGQFEKCLFLPERHPNVAAWKVNWWDDDQNLNNFQKMLAQWIRSLNFDISLRDDFLPHVTICRSPHIFKEWKDSFSPLPMMTKDLHLYESLGNSQYKPIWSLSIKSPFREIEHVADIAFRINGEDLTQIQNHAIAALAFKSPMLLNYLPEMATPTSLDDIIIFLNELITNADKEMGCPFKAASFHGNLIEEIDLTLSWEMIVDV